jgi:NAD(P)-dependent dehydrogenase (short-subunit alcohol dehydrogenase family)
LGQEARRRDGEAAESLKAGGIDAEYIKLDLDDQATHAAAAKEIAEKYGKLDILINNAGVFRGEEFDANGAPVPASQTRRIRSGRRLTRTFSIRCR